MTIQSSTQQFYEYSLHIKGYSKETIRRYRYVLEQYLAHSGVTELSEATTETIRALLFFGRTTKHWSANTAIIFHKSLYVFFRWCISQGYLSTNPVKDVEKPKLEQKLPKRISKQDAERLLEVVYNYPYENTFLRYRNHAMFATFMFAGLRRSELLNLRYGDVDFENMTLFVNQGKGKKDRFVPISYTLAETLRRYADERTKKRITCPEFFASGSGNIGFTGHGLKHLVEVIRKASGLKFSVHTLRHTFATLMLEGGCDIYSLSRMMGHSDIKTTTIYLYATATHLRAQIGKHPLNTGNSLH